MIRFLTLLLAQFIHPRVAGTETFSIQAEEATIDRRSETEGCQRERKIDERNDQGMTLRKMTIGCVLLYCLIFSILFNFFYVDHE